jgi:UDP-N-acetylenolpyruvoylglucosamine reductase
MRRYVSYDERTEDYEIEDDDGGTAIDLRTAKSLIELVRKTRPELLEKPKEKSFFKQMKHYDDTAAKMISLAGKLCDKARYGNCTVTRKKCPFKVNGGDGDYYCRLAATEEMMLE